MAGCERLVRPGGEGTPRVAEFAPAELATTLESSTHAGEALLADALDLRHRLPQLWARTQAGEVKPWLARKAAQATRHCGHELAGQIDAVIARSSDRVSWGRLEALILATWKRLDPAGATAAERGERTEVGVWLSPSSEHATKTLFARLEAPDAIRLDAAVQRAADALRSLGDTRGADQRRAAALGVLADPQDALDLDRQHAQLAAGTGPATGPVETDAPAAFRRSRRLDTGPQATLYVHLSEEAIRSDAGVARVEAIGPVTAGLVRDWRTGARVTVVPVIDLANMAPVDGYEIPTRLAEAVRLRSPLDAFPYATCSSRRMDLDHTQPYLHPDQGGPPGQTRTANLAPLTRRHHRIKTHPGWAVAQPFDGVLVWRSPHSRHYLVDHTGTTKATTAA